MRRVNTIALLFVYLSVNTNFHDIIRLPILFVHFYEHKQANREYNFVEFIVLHYFSGDVKDADYDRDQQLPFRGTVCEMTSLSIAITTDNAPVVPHRTGEVIQKLVMYSSPFTSSLAQFTIWQPPRS